MRRVKCPTCGQSMDADSAEVKDTMPFCSKRCRDVDLNRWLTEEYSVPVETERVIREADESEEDPSRGYWTQE